MSNSDPIIGGALAYSGALQNLMAGRCVALSHRSPDKETNNEDSCMCMQLGPRSAVLAVADGAGGHAAGAEASALALKLLREELLSAADVGNVRAAILNAIERSNLQLLELGKGSATTIAVAEIQGANVRHYQVGDSSIVVMGQRGAIRLQSVPQSLVGYGIEAGFLDEDAALEHDERHIVLNLLGTAEMRVEIGVPIAMRPRDTLLLCSDGLTDNVTISEVVETMRKGDLVAGLEQLRERAQDYMAQPQGHPDDLTLIAYRQ